MKSTRTFKAALICASVVLLGLPQLKANSVKFVRSIDLRQQPKGGTLGSLLFGRKEVREIRPNSVTRIRHNRYCLTDALSGTVNIIDASGKVIKRITRAGKLRLISPVSACCDDSGNLYVSDSAQGGVVKYDRDYNFNKIFLAPSGTRITGIVYFGGMFFFVDTQNHRVIISDNEGKIRKSFGQRGSGDGEFNFPTHISVDADFLYVTDALNFRIQIFDRKGNFRFAFGKPGRQGGNFSKPKGIAVDSAGRIFVADAMFDNIQIFNSRGDFLYHFGNPGHRDNEFWMPSDIMVDEDDTIWVVDTYNSRVQIFKVLGERP